MILEKLNIQSVCSYFHIACTLFLFSTLPFFYSKFTQYGLIFFFVSFIADYIASKRWQKGFKIDTSRVISILLILQFVLLLVFGLFEQDSRFLSTFFEKRTSLLGFGIVGLLGVSDKFKIRPFAYISILSVAICVYSTIDLLPWYFNRLDNLETKLNLARYIRAANISSHMMINTFMSVGMILFAKVVSISKSKLEKAFCIFMILVFYAIVMLSDGRIGIFNASIILLFIILRFTVKKINYLIPILFVILSVICASYVLVFIDNPIKDKIFVLNKNNPREYVWKDGAELIKESPFIGVGASTNALRVKEKLLNDEQLCSMEEFLIDHIKQDNVFAMHTHNQIMQSWQEYGLIGLFAILALFVSIFVYSRHSLSMILIFSMVAIQLITDVIDGSIGNLAFSMYVYLLLIFSKQMGKRTNILSSIG